MVAQFFDGELGLTRRVEHEPVGLGRRDDRLNRLQIFGPQWLKPGHVLAVTRDDKTFPALSARQEFLAFASEAETLVAVVVAIAMLRKS